AADMVAVRVRVDQQRDRLRRQLLDLVENRLAPARVLRVDHGHAVRVDEDGGVAAAAFQHEEVVLHLLDFDNLRTLRRRWWLIRADRKREHADAGDDCEEGRASHFFISSASFWIRPGRPPNSGGLGGGVFGLATVVGYPANFAGT